MRLGLSLFGLFIETAPDAVRLTVRGEPDGTTSHPTRLVKDTNQVVGYVEPLVTGIKPLRQAQGERNFF
jgi:hypothetical protein